MVNSFFFFFVGQVSSFQCVYFNETYVLAEMFAFSIEMLNFLLALPALFCSAFYSILVEIIDRRIQKLYVGDAA